MDTAIAGTGCSLMDYLSTGIDFSGPAFDRFRSHAPGDGGLVPGQLVFAEGLEKFAGMPYQEVLEEITAQSPPPSKNLGGPSVVALVHAAQLLRVQGVPVSFYGVRGDDSVGGDLASIVSKTPLHWDHYVQEPGHTPFTHALSDPTWDGGAGERSFVNSTGVAAHFRAADIDRSFFDHPITAFGGTALVPALHAELHEPLRHARRQGALTVVNTVYDFLNESKNPHRPWPIGDSEESYRNTDLLIVDAEEARRLSGSGTVETAAGRFVEAGVSALIITRGAQDLYALSRGGRFAPLEPAWFPVSERVGRELGDGAGVSGDTTGCGDNFVGGVLYAVAEQLSSGERHLDLHHAISWGVASGGYACFSLGGTSIEQHRGEKHTAIAEYVRDYRRQLGAVSGDA
ncbi:MAG TPA: carbohydrate kinase family protein [Alkalispirochaeta sp.]|nr:carbohydrate kinase family protein [Alkalispirochaeta sp.]